ncbi:MAG: maleylacetate reductase [Alcaligenaceae bacterium]|nr:maleylacetate reductase [Alcaligenaceae bacterium SAGV5]MPS53981.1 maleylacetate reductase [Alcaligenaceae bacterium SAGV3]MPT59326.1 maleylacetate reductase [Alcaligenaceae bacterium]
MQAFVYNGQPSRVVFGQGALSHLEREIDLLGAGRALVLATPEQRAQAEMIADRLGGRVAGIFARAVMHVPIETARDARDEARRLGADCAVAIGGGSTIGLGKAIALESGLPILAIPTTYAGSEMTPIYGITEAGLKKTGRDPRVLPRTVIYDPALTMTLPVGLSVASGMNAIAHAAEGLYARDGNPIMDLMAEEGIRALAGALPAIRHEAGDARARGDAFNASSAPRAMARIERALGTTGRASAAAALFDLARDNGAPVALKDIGEMSEADVARAADLAIGAPYWNPREAGAAQREAIHRLLLDAYHGTRPD